MPNDPRTKNGFSLIEVLLTLFFSIILTALLLTNSGSLLQTHSSNLQTIAARAATYEVENLRNTDFDSLPTSGAFTNADLAKLPQGSATRTIANYQSSQDIKQVSVAINWVQNNSPRQFIATTLIYKNGL